MIYRHSTKNRIAFYTLFAIILVLTFWLIRGYLHIVAFSLLAVIVLKPLYNVLFRWTGRRSGLATLATLVAFFLAIILPLWFAGRVVGNQLELAAADIQEPGSVEELSDEAHQWTEQCSGSELYAHAGATRPDPRGGSRSCRTDRSRGGQSGHVDPDDACQPVCLPRHRRRAAAQL